jgi:hypothetical protein
MKKCILILLLFFSVGMTAELSAQCSLCKKTAQQLGEKPAKGLNAGIIYLAAAPMLIVGFIGYRWYKRNRE